MTEQKKIDKENTLRTWTEEKIITAKRWIDEETTQKRDQFIKGEYIYVT
ncbi:hypothetical protein AAHH67_31480 [Niallia circulans]